ncbi:MAG: PH domain-containing protein [Mycobacterium sp.]|nr:PH domain-containing protein [Mycobacterium sp.]
MVLFIVGDFLFIWLLGDIEFVRILGTCFFIFTLLWFCWIVLDWYFERFVVTDRRVLIISGLLTRKVAIMPLIKVTDLTFQRSLPGQIFGYGVFIMENAGQNQAFTRIDYLPKPDRLYRRMAALLFGDLDLARQDPGDLLERYDTAPVPRISDRNSG